MNKNLINTSLILLLLICSCTVKERYIKLQGTTQGTTYHIIYSSGKGVNFSKEIDSILTHVMHNFSLWDSSSVISRINRNEYNEDLDWMFINLFNKAKEVYRQSSGAFNPTVGPLVDMWGFGAHSHHHIADTTKLSEIKRHIGMDKVYLNKNRLIKKDSLVALNFNAIAQGYSVDLVSLFFEKQGIKNYLVEIGGEVRVKGVNNKNEKWRIGIDKPVEGSSPGINIEALIELDNLSVSTSGNYRNFFVENGVKYAHHINPHTGYPERNNLLSVSIFTKECANADGYATAMLILGLDEAIKLAEKKKFNIYLIYCDQNGGYKQYISEGLKKMIIK